MSDIPPDPTINPAAEKDKSPSESATSSVSSSSSIDVGGGSSTESSAPADSAPVDVVDGSPSPPLPPVVARCAYTRRLLRLQCNEENFDRNRRELVLAVDALRLLTSALCTVAPHLPRPPVALSPQQQAELEAIAARATRPRQRVLNCSTQMMGESLDLVERIFRLGDGLPDAEQGALFARIATHLVTLYQLRMGEGEESDGKASPPLKRQFLRIVGSSTDSWTSEEEAEMRAETTRMQKKRRRDDYDNDDNGAPPALV